MNITEISTFLTETHTIQKYFNLVTINFHDKM